MRLLSYAKRSAELSGDENAVIRNVVEAANIMMQAARHEEEREIFERELAPAP